MTVYKQQDIVLLDFGFSEGIGYKKRPALIVSGDNYNKSRREVIAAAITSNIERILFADTKIERWKESGLLYPSLVTAIVRTVKNNTILRKLGILSEEDFRNAQKNLAKAIGL